MIRIILMCVALTGLLSVAQAQDVKQLWTDGAMPYAKANKLVEETQMLWGTPCVLNVTKPELYVYPAKGVNSGKAVIILPGGGYEVEAIQHEGHDVAKALSDKGITGAVLKYRLPLAEASDQPHLLPITDVQRAFELMRQAAHQYGFNTDEVGVMGFSAGAHLAAFACSKPTHQPDFSLIVYGCPRLTKENVEWLESKLFHRKMTKEEYDEFNILQSINADTPPAFLVHALDDKVCYYEETTVYAEALHQHKVPFELHTFPTGGHGFGLGDEKNGTNQWIGLAISWIKRL
ncbi:MAG: alpha/beta hydrolase [Carboxylicivirga sp.]|jgi:acetyl esterase/lipase|nr:alpha/beta hydrolase [Carboxylicivirga sp.]